MTSHVGGISSGIDTEALINSIIESKSIPKQRLEAKVETDQTKLVIYDEIESRASSLKTTALQLTLSTVWGQRKATTSDNTKASATAALGAQEGTYTLKIGQIATAQRVQSANLTNLADYSESLGMEGKFTINGQEVTVEKDDSLQKIVSKLKTASGKMDTDSQISAYVVDRTLILETAATGKDQNMEITDTDGILGKLGLFTQSVSAGTETAITSPAEDGTLTVNGTLVKLTSGMSVDDIAAAINDAEPGVTASVSNGKLKFDGDVSIGGSLASAIGFSGDTSKNVSREAQDFKGSMNDITINSSSNKMDTIVSGLTFDVKETAQSGDTVSITVGNDTESVKTLVKSFIEEYNNTITLIKQQTKVVLGENNTGDTEIDGVGYLQGESYLASFVSQMNSAVLSLETNTNQYDATASTPIRSIFDLGISMSDEGQLYFSNESNFDELLNTRFDDVQKIFANRELSAESGKGTSPGGIATQLNKVLDRALDPIDGGMTLRMQTIQDRIDYNNKRISELETYLEKQEEMLWNHYANLEDLISNSNSQLSMLEAANNQNNSDK